MNVKPDTESLEAEIAGLPALGLGELRALWEKLYGRLAPKFFRRKFLVRAVAYQMQVKAYGGLAEATKRKLREIAAAAHDGTFDAATVGPRIKPGIKLVRTWHGETHTVMALEQGFSWNGSHYSSLSAIAKAITGTAWNGWSFFGLKSSPAERGRDVLGRFKRPAAGPQGAPAWPRSRKAPPAIAQLEAVHA